MGDCITVLWANIILKTILVADCCFILIALSAPSETPNQHPFIGGTKQNFHRPVSGIFKQADDNRNADFSFRDGNL